MEDLKLIKKHYGEKMSHLCRELFPTILEEEGKLFKLLSSSFVYSKCLYDDIINNDLEYQFKNYIYALSDDEIVRNEVAKSPKELMDEAGYILYECTNCDQVKYFEKYYEEDEALCTFKDINCRLEKNYIFFAIKKDVDNIKREDFIKPKRQDAYGTSVISIQFTKGDINTLSIKNRYNHTVVNPDATFSNNLDNIIEGLTESFNKEYNLNIGSDIYSFEIPGYVKSSDKKFYKYNYEFNNIYYCPNNIIIDNFEVKEFDKERYIICDYFILDMKDKTIKLYDEDLEDSFINIFEKINKIEIKKERITKDIIIDDQIIITLDNLNNIIKYKDEKTKEIDDYFLFYEDSLIEIDLPSVVNVKHYFLGDNKCLQKVNLPNVENIGAMFLRCNHKLEKISLPKVIEIGDNFLCANYAIKDIDLPNVNAIGNQFLYFNHHLLKIELPNVRKIGNEFLFFNNSLREFKAPNLIEVGSDFLWGNELLMMLDIKKTESVAYRGFLENNKFLKKIIISKAMTEDQNNKYILEKLTSKLPDLEVVFEGESYIRTKENKIKLLRR